MGLFKNFIKEVVNEKDLNKSLKPLMEKIIEDRIEILNVGSRGIAFTASKYPDIVFKITDDESEYYTAKKVMQKNLKHVVKVYNVAIFKSKFFNYIKKPFGNKFEIVKPSEYYFLKLEKVFTNDQTDELLHEVFVIANRAVKDVGFSSLSEFKMKLMGGEIPKKDLSMIIDNFEYWVKKINKSRFNSYMHIIQQFIYLILELKNNKILTLDFSLENGLNLGFRDTTLVLFDLGHSFVEGQTRDEKDVYYLD